MRKYEQQRAMDEADARVDRILWPLTTLLAICGLLAVAPGWLGEGLASGLGLVGALMFWGAIQALRWRRSA